MTVSDGERDRPITLQNILYVPELRTNLLSVAKIVDKNHYVLFTEKRAYVKDAVDKIKIIADREGDLFYLRQNHEKAYSVLSDVSDSAMEWHRRLGHLNWSDMVLMFRNKSVSGAKLDTSNALPPCDICAAGKLATFSFPKRDNGATILLEVVHADVCGPVRVGSRGGARFFLMFTDEYSRYTEVYFLKHKSEVASKFSEYKNMAENQTGNKIKALQSDNGHEFCNSEMDSILKKAGIRRRLTAPYTPQQNGIAEHKNRTLVEAARCMLAESDLPEYF